MAVLTKRKILWTSPSESVQSIGHLYWIISKHNWPCILVGNSRRGKTSSTTYWSTLERVWSSCTFNGITKSSLILIHWRGWNKIELRTSAKTKKIEMAWPSLGCQDKMQDYSFRQYSLGLSLTFLHFMPERSPLHIWYLIYSGSRQLFKLGNLTKCYWNMSK